MAMKKIELPVASRLTSPNPVTLVCTKKADGETNLATVSWWTYLSFDPNTIGFAMAKTSFSGERTRETKEVVLTIPGAAIASQVMSCGTCSGRDTDKAAKFGVELVAVEGSDIKIPAHSRVAICCALKEHHEVGDHYLYICDVKGVFANEDEEAVFAWKGYGEIAPAAKK